MLTDLYKESFSNIVGAGKTRKVARERKKKGFCLLGLELPAKFIAKERKKYDYTS